MDEWDVDSLEDTLKRLVADAIDGERQLVAALEGASESVRTGIVAALGEATGEQGGPLLRALAEDRSVDTDTRAMAIIALAKRVGSEGSATYSACLRHRDVILREAATIAMASVGDARDVEVFRERLVKAVTAHPGGGPRLIPKQMLSTKSDILQAVVYLVRHLDESARQELASCLFRHREALAKPEREWLTVYWPEAAGFTDAGLPPDIPDLVAWQKKPLLDPYFS